MTGTNERRYCVLAVNGPMAGRTRAALMDEFKWQGGTRIRVGFTDGDPELQQRVRAVAEQWTGPEMANLRLQFVPDSETADADIRVAFKQGDGSWSYLGTVCRQIPAAEPTMNYGWLTPQSSDEEVREVVLHEFGHALGLIHEHQNPDRPIAWNRAAVIADLSGPPNNWDEATIEHNIFKKYDPDEVTTTPVDPRSIMMYPIPASWTTDGFSAGFNTDLSDVDRAFIRDAYPW
ncbi:M12 family metallopeptidase [Pseudonocardia nigra]|uniref:M12 family metallopeptidase n=1 Tax=Pseudonocardia nigra TaxID=1921578 RepID=UPI001C5EE328|nr:M12 family metallopeptidase [Pseudonocardia nigra]